MVGEYGQCGELSSLACPLPLDPSVMLAGIIPDECSVYKSALSPLRLTFRVAGARMLRVPLAVPEELLGWLAQWVKHDAPHFGTLHTHHAK